MLIELLAIGGSIKLWSHIRARAERSAHDRHIAYKRWERRVLAEMDARPSQIQEVWEGSRRIFPPDAETIRLNREKARADRIAANPSPHDWIRDDLRYQHQCASCRLVVTGHRAAWQPNFMIDDRCNHGEDVKDWT